MYDLSFPSAPVGNLSFGSGIRTIGFFRHFGDISSAQKTASQNPYGEKPRGLHTVANGLDISDTSYVLVFKKPQIAH